MSSLIPWKKREFNTVKKGALLIPFGKSAILIPWKSTSLIPSKEHDFNTVKKARV